MTASISPPSKAATVSASCPSGEDVLCQIGLGGAGAVAPWGEVDAGHPLGRASVGPGPDGLGIVSVMCCCRLVCRAGS
jgi:hypothetical protein